MRRRPASTSLGAAGWLNDKPRFETCVTGTPCAISEATWASARCSKSFRFSAPAPTLSVKPSTAISFSVFVVSNTAMRSKYSALAVSCNATFPLLNKTELGYTIRTLRSSWAIGNTTEGFATGAGAGAGAGGGGGGGGEAQRASAAKKMGASMRAERAVSRHINKSP